jgi:hypothetical protein
MYYKGLKLGFQYWRPIIIRHNTEKFKFLCDILNRNFNLQKQANQ